jgi:hypothetical protein
MYYNFNADDSFNLEGHQVGGAADFSEDSRQISDTEDVEGDGRIAFDNSFWDSSDNYEYDV